MSPVEDNKRFRSQMRTLDTAALEVFSGVFGGSSRPADRILSDFFREHRQCGSRDRGFISEAVFALLRYWGVLREFLPPARRDELECGAARPARHEIEGLLFGALYCEGRDMTAIRALGGELNLSVPHDVPRSLERKIASLKSIFGVAAEGAEVNFDPACLIPEWAEKMLPDTLDKARFFADLAVRPPMWIRLQCADPESEVFAEFNRKGLEFQRHRVMTDFVSLPRPKVNLFTLDSYREGKFEVQDLASGGIAAVCAPHRRQRWLDCCAGAGGKSLALAAAMERTGTVVASDVRSYKLEDLRRRARRAQFPNIETREWSERLFRRSPFDGVLVDAPCSCAGVWRRNPDGRWGAGKESEPEQLAATQLEILRKASAAVRPGGVLVYATCSIFEVENRGVVGAFLAGNGEFELQGFPHPLTGEPVADGMLNIWSYDGDCDSTFIARMVRRRAATEGGGEATV